jgi:hypothetical protein
VVWGKRGGVERGTEEWSGERGVDVIGLASQSYMPCWPGVSDVSGVWCVRCIRCIRCIRCVRSGVSGVSGQVYQVCQVCQVVLVGEGQRSGLGRRRVDVIGLAKYSQPITCVLVARV